MNGISKMVPQVMYTVQDCKISSIFHTAYFS